MSEAYLFQRSDEGLADFAAYLKESPRAPAYLLLDLVEEEYRRDTIPHVIGQDRQTVIKYRVERAFRETPYWRGVVQGREAEGRRDDRLLISAITNPALVRPWVERLREHKVPLAGIYSLPLVSESLLPVLGAEEGEVLLVSLQSTGNLRQSYFLDRHLKLSRLAHMPLLAPEGVVETTMDEVEKLRRYLNSLRLLRRDGVLQVYVLAHGPVMEELQRRATTGPSTAYQLVDLADLAEQLGMNPAFVTPYSDAVFAHQLLASRPANHYASADETHYYTLHRVRSGLRASSFALLALGVLGGGYRATEGLILERQALRAAEQADFYAARYQEARGDLPPAPVDAGDLKAAVETAEALGHARATPLPLLAVVSRVLDGFPDLQVERVQWRADPDPEAALGASGEAAASRPTRGPRREERVRGEVEPAEGLYHLAVVSGRVALPDASYRLALETVRDLAATLKQQPGVQDVRILTQPLNVGSGDSLQGDLKSAQVGGSREFSVRVVYRQPDAPA
jgi:hypothetical protein